MNKTTRSGLVCVALGAGLSLLGLAVSALLLHHHVIIRVGGDPILGGLCTVTAGASCDDVLASSWAVVGGLPTAMWGFFFFAAMSAWFLLIGRPTGAARKLNLVPIAASGVGTAFCVVLAAVMYTTLDHWCPYCALTHLITFLLFVTSVCLWPRGQADSTLASFEHAPSRRGGVGVVLLAAAISAAGWSEYHRQLAAAYADQYKARLREYESDYQSLHEKMMADRAYDIPIEPDDPVRGSADAKHTAVVFSDILCPHCARMETVLNQQVETHPDKLRVIFKHYPMNKTCNKHIGRDMHPGACEAAWATEAARLIGGNDAFWSMLDDLFSNVADLRAKQTETLNAAVARIGLDNETFWKTIKTPAARKRIINNITLARELGVKGTPRVFLDGRLLTRWSDRLFWRYLLRDANNVVAASQPEADK